MTVATVDGRSCRAGTVPLEPFQERFAQMEAAPPVAPKPWPKDAGTVIAERLGWYTPAGCIDSPRVRRVLGLVPYPDGRRGPRVRTRVTEDMAERLCEAMDLDPVDVGL